MRRWVTDKKLAAHSASTKPSSASEFIAVLPRSNNGFGSSSAIFVSEIAVAKDGLGARANSEPLRGAASRGNVTASGIKFKSGEIVATPGALGTYRVSGDDNVHLPQHQGMQHCGGERV